MKDQTYNERLIHRGQLWGDKVSKPNSFESVRELHESLGDKAVIEFDILLSREGDLVVLHPADFVKSNGEKLSNSDIENMTSRDIEEILRVTDPLTQEKKDIVPHFSELISLSYDRGIPLMIEIKSSSPDQAKITIVRAIEEIEKMKQDGVFEQGDHPNPRYSEQKVFLTSFSIEALEEGKKVCAQKGLDIRFGLLWSSTPQYAQTSEISATAVKRFTAGQNWEMAGVDVAKAIGCRSICFQPLDTITPELIDAIHHNGMEIHVGKIGKPELIRKFVSMPGIDKVVY